MSNSASRNVKNKKAGFIALVSLLMLVIFAILGISYWLSSRLTTDLIVTEAYRVKARNLAQSALEKVKINIANQYHRNNFNMTYSSGAFTRDDADEMYNTNYDNMSMSVISINRYELDGRVFFQVPHYRDGIKIGYYDIWEIKTRGQFSNVSVNKTSLIKVYRDYVQY